MIYKSLLITRPFYDNPTSYLYHWSEAFVDAARKKGVKVIDLKSDKAIASEVEGRLKKINPDLVVINGHGSQRELYGQNDQVLISLGKNEKLLTSKIVFARSCSSAKLLGKKCVKNGTICYIGYDEDFIFVFDINCINNPLKDKTAKLFLGPSNQIIHSLLKGNLTGQANEKSKKMFMKNIIHLLNSQTTKNNTEIVTYLLWDMNHQVCLGDKNAKI